MGLNKDPRFFLVGVAEIFACFDGFGETSFEIIRLGDADAIGARRRRNRAEPSVRVGGEAIHRPRQHQRERVLARAARAGEDYGLGKAVVRQHLAQAIDDLRISVKIRERHRFKLPRRR